MSKILKYIAYIPASIFTIMGVGWLLLPKVMGEQLGMQLLKDTGLSTQIGDLASFFMTMGSCIFLGLISQKKLWFYPVIMMLLFASFGRTIAYLFHGAAFSIDLIAVEIMLTILLYFVSNKIEQK